MHKDFHLYATFLAAAEAGYSMEEARHIAFAAQMVDDFDETHSKLCHTVTGMIGKSLKAFWETYILGNNSSIIDISDTWMPFHFIPERTLQEVRAGDTAELFACGFGEPIVAVCGDMIPQNSQESEKLSLTRIGITMHVLADSFAHSGFTGITCYNPRIAEKIRVVLLNYREGLSMGDHVPVGISFFTTGIVYYGHGTAAHMPDLSWATYCYSWKNRYQERMFERDNPKKFADAYEKMVEILKLMRAGMPPRGGVGFNTVMVRKYLRTEAEKIQKKYSDILDRNNAICTAQNEIPEEIGYCLKRGMPLTPEMAETYETIRSKSISVRSMGPVGYCQTDVKVGVLLDESIKSLDFGETSDKAFENFYKFYKNDTWPMADELERQYRLYCENKGKDQEFEGQAQLHKDAVYRAIHMNYDELVKLLEREF